MAQGSMIMRGDKCSKVALLMVQEAHIHGVPQPIAWTSWFRCEIRRISPPPGTRGEQTWEEP